jgi:hypothetical protein
MINFQNVLASSTTLSSNEVLSFVGASVFLVIIFIDSAATRRCLIKLREAVERSNQETNND